MNFTEAFNKGSESIEMPIRIFWPSALSLTIRNLVSSSTESQYWINASALKQKFPSWKCTHAHYIISISHSCGLKIMDINTSWLRWHIINFLLCLKSAKNKCEKRVVLYQWKVFFFFLFFVHWDYNRNDTKQAIKILRVWYEDSHLVFQSYRGLILNMNGIDSFNGVQLLWNWRYTRLPFHLRFWENGKYLWWE